VCSLVQAAFDLSAVRVEPDEPHTTAYEPLGSGLEYVADTATHMTAFCSIQPNKAHAATDEPPLSGRGDAANDSTDKL